MLFDARIVKLRREAKEKFYNTVETVIRNDFLVQLQKQKNQN